MIGVAKQRETPPARDDAFDDGSRELLLGRHRIEEYGVFFHFVGTVLAKFPSRELFATLVRERAFEGLPLSIDDDGFKQGAALLAAWNSRLDGVLSEEGYHELLADNTYLFAGLQEMAAPPWESFYFNKERMIFQEEAFEVRKWYRSHGLQVNKMHSEPDDHIGLELIFIARLLAEALSSDSEKLVREAHSFAVGHPLRWVARWADRVSCNAKTDLYQGLALVIPAALAAFDDEVARAIG